MGTSSVKRTCSINDKCNLPLSPKFQFNENEIRLKIFTKISLKWRCHVRKSSKIMKSHEFVIPMNLWKLSKKQVLVSSKSNHSKMIIGTQFNINCFNILNDNSIAPSKQTSADNAVRVLSLPRFCPDFRKILSGVFQVPIGPYSVYIDSVRCGDSDRILCPNSVCLNCVRCPNFCKKCFPMHVCSFLLYQFYPVSILSGF